MTLEDYDKEVRPHLNFIQAGAEMAARHARALAVRPSFETKAEDQLHEARKVLESALASVIDAEVAFENKPQEQSHAA